ncbi:MAG: cyclic pyranopterin monophosphate synthase MoaC [Acidimicrobiales bacterium]
MVDVTRKPWTHRRATARCRVALGEAGGGATLSGGEGRSGAPAPWTELLDAARLAGIQAAKQTARLIPLCHPLTSCDVKVMVSVAGGVIEVESHAEVVGPTGVEMEALTACAGAALTIWRRCCPAIPTPRSRT